MLVNTSLFIPLMRRKMSLVSSVRFLKETRICIFVTYRPTLTDFLCFFTCIFFNISSYNNVTPIVYLCFHTLKFLNPPVSIIVINYIYNIFSSFIVLYFCCLYLISHIKAQKLILSCVFSPFLKRRGDSIVKIKLI